LITFSLSFILLILLFLNGSGSAAFNDGWFKLILVIGVLHFLACIYKFRNDKKYYLFIPFIILIIYLYFYFG
jgi:hypothetical protein